MSSASSTPSGAINLLDLAAACIASTATATSAIQKILDAPNTRRKPDGSFVTDADFAAQGSIVHAIQQLVHPEIDILGEESVEEMAQHMESYAWESETVVYRRAQHEVRLRYHKSGGDVEGGGPSRTKDEDVSTSTSTSVSPTIMPLSSHANNDESYSSADGSTADIPDRNFPPDPPPIDISRLRIVVDPLDGTKSYATGEYEAVSILVAILVDAKPTFGVIGKPFGYTDYPTLTDTPCVTFYGGSLLGGVFCAGATAPLSSPTTTVLPTAVISSSRSHGVVHDFCQHLATDHGLLQPEPLHISGAGEKSLWCLLQRQNAALWFFPKAGTSLWDVAAPDALLRAMGGTLTDKYGRDIVYANKSREEAENVHGVVACSNVRLHEQCIALFLEKDWVERSNAEGNSGAAVASGERR